MWEMLFDIKPLFVKLVITSGLDGKHMKNSLHYAGLAVDIRTRHINKPLEIYEKIKIRLGNKFDVIYYDTHIHIERNWTE